jgi:hypothetical protein
MRSLVMAAVATIAFASVSPALAEGGASNVRQATAVASGPSQMGGVGKTHMGGSGGGAGKGAPRCATGALCGSGSGRPTPQWRRSFAG